jgi:hypothetical protein
MGDRDHEHGIKQMSDRGQENHIIRWAIVAMKPIYTGGRLWSGKPHYTDGRSWPVKLYYTDGRS